MAKMGDVGMHAYRTVVRNLLENVHMEGKGESGRITLI
jgi:hypothetical protein